MWISSFLSSIGNFALALFSTTLAYSLLLGAIVFCIYVIVDIRVPRLVIGPIVAILTFSSAYILGNIEGVKSEKLVCENKDRVARENYEKQLLDISIQLRAAQQSYAQKRLDDLKANQAELQDLQEQLNQVIAQDIVKESMDNAVKATPGACLPVNIPSNIMQSINKAGR